MVPVGFPVQTGGGNVCIQGEVVFGLGNEPSGVAPDGGLHHGSVRIDEGGGGARGKSSVPHQILDSRFLPELALQFVGEAVCVGIVVRAESEAAELVQLEPIHHTVRIIVLVALEVMGDDLASHRYIQIDLAGGRPVRSRLAHPIDRPVGEVVPVGLPVQAGGGNVGVEGEKVFALGYEPGRIAFDGGLDHGGVGVDEGGGGTG